uniref:Uncharacterized protein n=1 Tax=Anopheles dirus TaxID=7168 RepID=A0A182NXF8_9DIPT
MIEKSLEGAAPFADQLGREVAHQHFLREGDGLQQRRMVLAQAFVKLQEVCIAPFDAGRERVRTGAIFAHVQLVYHVLLTGRGVSIARGSRGKDAGERDFEAEDHIIRRWERSSRWPLPDVLHSALGLMFNA